MKLSKKDIVVLIGAAAAAAGIFLPLVHAPVGYISFWGAEGYSWASGVHTQIASILMIVCACVFAVLTLVEAKIPILKFRKTIGFAGILVLVIPLCLVVPAQIKGYYERATSNTPHWLQTVGDKVSGSVANVGMKTVSFQIGLYVFVVGLLLCFAIGLLKLAKKW